MSPSRLPFPSFPLSLGPFLSWFPSACRHVPTHLRSRLTTLPSVHPNTVPLCTAPTQPITRLLFHFSSVFTFPLSTFPQVRSSTVHESTHRPRARPCEYPPCSQFHLFTFSLSTVLPIHTPLCTIHPPTYLPTYLPPSLPPFAHLLSSLFPYPLPFYLLLICSSTPHIYAVHPLLTSTHHNSLSTHPPITLPPSTTHYSMSTLPPLHLFILYVRPIPILLSARPSFRPSTLLSHHLSVRSHILPSTLIHSSPTYTFRLFGVL